METATTPMSPKPLENATCLLGDKGCYQNGKCHYIGNCEHKVKTKADRIRAMTDEELARMLYCADGLGWCSNNPKCGELLDTPGGIPEENCLACLLAWLKQPPKEDAP